MKEPKVELAFNNILISADKVSETLITTLDSRNAARQGTLKDIQTIVKIGPFIKKENGIDLKPGDVVLLDYEKLSAKNARVLSMIFDKKTMKYVEGSKAKNYKDEELITYLLITDREILMKLED